MPHFHFVHHSNRTEKLYEELKERLFASSHPLTKRVIIVPSAAMKSWLMLQMAEDPAMGISAGIEIGFVEPTINRLYHFLSENTNKPEDVYEPSVLELALALEENIQKIATDFQSLPHLSQKTFLPLLQYLGVANQPEKKLSKTILKRIRALSSALAQVFCDYGIYGKKMLADWTQDSLEWQKLLWEQMEVLFSLWNYPARKLEAFKLNDSFQRNDIQIHLFGLSYLSPIYHEFLEKISQQIPVYYYLLSPCQKFWGDTLSDKESVRLKTYWEKQGAHSASLEALEEFLRDRNPLLANFGRLGREMTQYTESMDSSEAYVLPDSILEYPHYRELDSGDMHFEKALEPLTLLEAVQADIALLRTVDHQEHVCFESYDASIQIHGAPKKVREVQVIYDALIGIINKHHKDSSPILPSDIFVMAPNISEYAPFIRSVFESTESRLDVQLMDLQLPSQHILIQGFLHLLSLSKSRWEASSLLQLFDYKAFRTRQHLSEEDVRIIKKWVQEAGIYWGKDHDHRKEIFQRDYDEKLKQESLVGTWEYGLGRLLEGLAMLESQAHEEIPHYFPVDRVETSKGDLLGFVIHLIRSLQDDLKSLVDGSMQTLEDWSTYLKCLLEGYFSTNTHDTEEEGYKILVGHIESFSRASRRLKEATFSFETIYKHLKEHLEKETASYKESNLNAVRFSSLLPMRAVPAKVVVLMGMNEGMFPRIDQTNTLNLLLENPKADYCPAKVDFDRYIFLESILSARCYFIASYICLEPGDVKTKAPSLLLKELMGYLDLSYKIQEDKPSLYCHSLHPLNAFHHSYFSENSRFKTYSKHHYLAALSHYQPDKQQRAKFLSEFNPASVALKDSLQETVIDLKELLAVSKSPLKAYLNQMGIYLSQDLDRVIKDEEELFLSDLNASILIKEGVFGFPKNTLIKAEKSGKLPPGPFKALGEERIERDIEHLLKNLKSSGIDLHTLFSIELSDHSTEATFSENVWKLPPLIFSLPEHGKVKILGKINDVCEKGLVLLYQEDLKKIFELWPVCLVLRYLIEKHDLPISPQIIFVKGKKAKIKEICSTENQTYEKSLLHYLDYYFKAKLTPSPLLPDLIPSILDGIKEELQNVFKVKDQDFRPQFDQYLNWLGRNSPEAQVVSTVDHWQEIAQHLFVDVVEKKHKKTADQIEE